MEPEQQEFRTSDLALFEFLMARGHLFFYWRREGDCEVFGFVRNHRLSRDVRRYREQAAAA